MQTVADNIKDDAERLLRGIEELLGTGTPLRDVNAGDGSIVLVGAHYAFPDLDLRMRRLQSRLREERTHLFAIIRVLLHAQTDSVTEAVENWDEALTEVIDQQHLVWYSTTHEALAAAKKAVAEMLEGISSMYDPAEGSILLIPDSNALILSPAFQDWRFLGIDKFEILLVPTLLDELDGLKVEHRNQDVRNKAQSVIRQLKEYRRRGPLTKGVMIEKGRISLRSSAKEPRVDQSLPWLDAASPDDRLLASCIEVMRTHPRSTVVLVTDDINLQNKAEFARIPFVEPPAEKHVKN